MKNLNYIVTCKNRFLGKCKNCQKDYDASHHPNNYDCPMHERIRLIEYNICENPDKNYSKNTQKNLKNFR